MDIQSTIFVDGGVGREVAAARYRARRILCVYVSCFACNHNRKHLQTEGVLHWHSLESHSFILLVPLSDPKRRGGQNPVLMCE